MSRGLEMAREVAVHGGGRLVKTMGDELMLVFATARQAADSAVEIQEEVSELARGGGIRLDFRIGFHFGEAIERDGDVFGDSVNTAARLVALAKAGQILTSSSTVAVLPENARPPMREVDTITVKGKQLDLDVVELLWQATAELTVVSRRPLTWRDRSGASSRRLDHAAGCRDACDHAWPRRAQRRGHQGPAGIPPARADRAAARQVCARRLERERHLHHVRWRRASSCCTTRSACSRAAAASASAARSTRTSAKRFPSSARTP